MGLLENIMIYDIPREKYFFRVKIDKCKSV